MLAAKRHIEEDFRPMEGLAPGISEHLEGADLIPNFAYVRIVDGG
jgi:hypothetical protein